MKNKRMALIVLTTMITGLAQAQVQAQILTFDQIDATYSPATTGMARPITWYTSDWGGGFAHKIYNADYLGRTYIKFANRHNSANWVDALTIASDGKIGVGESEPLVKFEIAEGDPSGLATYVPILKLKSNNWQCDQQAVIEFWNGAANKNFATSKIISKMDGCGAMGEALIFETQTAGLTHTTPKLTIKNNGQILVGTQAGAPDAAFFNINADGATYTRAFEIYDQYTQKVNFSVRTNGNVWCRELNILVNTNDFPDYVFKKGYDLMSFDALGAFIKENHHLPNIPAAEEVGKNGMQLADLSMKQLQKIEELTLYILELEKRLKALEKEK